jgi:hypothetical protein
MNHTAYRVPWRVRQGFFHPEKVSGLRGKMPIENPPGVKQANLLCLWMLVVKTSEISQRVQWEKTCLSVNF